MNLSASPPPRINIFWRNEALPAGKFTNIGLIIEYFGAGGWGEGTVFFWVVTQRVVTVPYRRVAV